MAADVATALKTWSTTAASNSPAGTTVISTNLDDNLREIQAVVRDLASPNTIAAAASMDLGAVDETFLTTTGTAETITAFGTVSAGIYKWLIFNAAHTLTHNATSLILPGAANITCADKDTGLFVSLGSGNWRCLSFTRASGAPLATTIAGLTLTSPVLTTPQINDTSSDHQYVFASSELTADRTVTLPLLTGNDTFVFASHAQTLANKTLALPTMTRPTISSGSVKEAVEAPAAGASFTVAATTAGIYKLTTNANTTITLPDAETGAKYKVIVAYGGAHTVTWAGGSTIVWPGGTAPNDTSSNGKYDIYEFISDGTITYGMDGGRNLS